jgi:predicted AlkP superfamily phosphohydrolase/phosphomutase
MDGATLDLIKPWVAEGKLPHLGKLIETGACGPLESTTPDHTPMAWTSFMTGVNAGKHGIFDFLQRDPKGYAFKPINALHRCSPPFWKLASDAGLKVGVINVPVTFPPDHVNGFMISGMDTPGTDSDFIHPPELHEELNKRFGDYQIDTPIIPRSRVHSQEFLDAVENLVDYRSKVTMHMMKESEWDLFVVVFVATDRVQHDFWHFMDPQHPFHDATAENTFKTAIYDVYARMDKLVGDIVQSLDDQTHLVIISDHGFGPNSKIFDLNIWLEQQGYLVPRVGADVTRNNFIAKFRPAFFELRQHVPKWLRNGLKKVLGGRHQRILSASTDLQLLWGQTTAYSEGAVGNVRINLQGREPLGIVPPGEEYEQLRDALIDGLKKVEDPETGQRIIQAVLKREDVYSGDCLTSMPDLVVVPVEGYRCRTNVRRSGISGEDARIVIRKATWSGDHRRYGILFIKGPGTKTAVPVEDARIIDVAPTVMHLLGLPVPSFMEGQVLESAFTPEYIADHPVTLDDTGGDEVPAPEPSDPDPKADDAADKALRERLRSLGYLE